MGDTAEPVDDPGTESTSGQVQPVDRHAYWDDGFPGHPLSQLLFACTAHGEEKLIEYYDPDDPPRCTQGDLMERRPLR